VGYGLEAAAAPGARPLGSALRERVALGAGNRVDELTLDGSGLRDRFGRGPEPTTDS
jgi:hypothetical protein